MTNEYKKNLLDYATKQLQNTSPTTSEIFKEQIDINRSEWVDFLPNSWVDFNFEGLIPANENTSNLNILYGGYYTTGNITDAKGVIILCDMEFKPVKAFYQYESGTDLRYIQKMIQAEDNTFYMIDDTFYSPESQNYTYESDFSNGTRRFVMLNNFSVPIENEYKLNLRTSYIFGSDYNKFYCRDIFKDPNSAHFVFLGKYFETYKNTKTISLVVNVGTTNEWEYINSSNYEYFGGFVSFDDSSNYSVRMMCNQASALRNYYITATKGYNDNNYTYTNTGNFNYYIDVDTENYQNQVVFINENEVYFVGNNQARQIGPDPYDKYIGLYYYNYSNGTMTTIYEEFIENAKAINKRAIYITKHQNEIYLQYNTNIDTNNSTADYYYQRLVNRVWQPIFIANNKFIRNQRMISVNSKYNLLSIYLVVDNPRSASWYNHIIKEIYNQNQYNGESYVNNNVFCPLYSNLYSNGSLVFSRNLYNTTIFENTTTSSVEVPSNYLNNLTITQEDLISSTNFLLVNNLQNIQKNIYETLHINYFNTINVIDEDTNKQYKLGAIKINNAITNGGNTNYNNSPFIKYRINYADGTTSIQNLNWTNINVLNKQTYFTISVSKEIKNIDIISNDESTIYLTINGNFEVGKDYTIYQKVRIGEKPISQELQYNGENVLYNNEQVKVYTQ